jgi:demethylmacrocin O-methyltransferase
VKGDRRAASITYYRALQKARVSSRTWPGGREVDRVTRVLGRRNLSWLATAHGTDKRPGAGRHGYAPIYERHIADLRHRPVRVLEIGVLKGASLRMWHDYFARGHIVGIDLDPPALEDLPRATTIKGDQSDPAVLEQAAQLGPFDLVIDDGSHIGSHIRASFDVLFGALRPGAFYVIEDLQTSYNPKYEGGAPGTPDTGIEVVKQALDAVNRRWWDGATAVPVEEVHVYEKIAFIKKASAPA